MPIIRKQLKPSDVYPEDIRYNADTDEVQSLVNGDWVDNPAADPRHQTTFPPRVTANPACDAAESVKDAFKGQIDQILTAIDNTATTFTVAGLILGLFSFGVFEIFIAIAMTIANAMIDAGTTALSAALTDPAYHQFVCILRCHFNGSGRIDSGGLLQAQSEINDQIGGLAAVVLNSMLSLAGEGGVNNLASLGTSTGDCSDCDPCGDPCYTKFNVTTGTLLGIFDGYMRVQSANSGGTSIIQIDTGDPAICCQLLDFRDVSGGENISARYHINCGADISPGNIASGWFLEGCYDWMACQSPTGTTPDFVVEFLLTDC